MEEQSTKQFGLTKAVSIIYFFLGIAFAVMVIKEIELQGIVLSWKQDIWIPLLFIVSAIGTIRLTKWGRWLSYVTSILCLLGVPIGTIIGGFMIWHLTKYRASFSQWY